MSVEPYDILDAVYRLRHAFKGNNIEPPNIIELPSQMDGMKLVAHIEQRSKDQIYTVTPLLQGRRWQNELEIMGIKFRWPAQMLRTKTGMKIV